MPNETASAIELEPRTELTDSLADIIIEEIAAAAGQAERERDLLLGKKTAEYELRLALLEQAVRERLAAVRNGEKGECGEKGEKGESIAGPPGSDGKDGKDGKDGAQITIRGTYDPAAAYSNLDAVATGGSTFVAKLDNPGPCPGDGWQLWASCGRQGKPGPKGERGIGEPGPSGPPGRAPVILDWEYDFKNFRAFPVMSDKSTAPPIELRGFFEHYQELANG